MKLTLNPKTAAIRLNTRQFDREETVGYLFFYFFLVIVVFLWIFPGLGFGPGLLLEALSMLLCHRVDRGVKKPNINFLIRYAYSGFIVSLRIYPPCFCVFMIMRLTQPIQGLRVDLMILYMASFYALCERMWLHHAVVTRQMSTPWNWHITPRTFKRFFKEFTEAMNRHGGRGERQPVPDSLHCPHCQSPVKATDRLCLHCGGKLEKSVRTCQACGGPVSRAVRFCPLCGVELTPANREAGLDLSPREGSKPETRAQQPKPKPKKHKAHSKAEKPLVISPTHEQPAREPRGKPIAIEIEPEDQPERTGSFFKSVEEPAFPTKGDERPATTAFPQKKPPTVSPAVITPAPEYSTSKTPTPSIIQENPPVAPAVTAAPDYRADAGAELSPAIGDANGAGKSGIKKRKDGICRTCRHFDEPSESCRLKARPVYEGYCYHHNR